jgi:hypothetical protein
MSANATVTVPSLFERYNEAMAKADPRVRHLPMTSSIIPLLSMLLVYLMFVLTGPIVMKNRKAMQLRGVLIFYNFALVALSCYMFYEFLFGAWLYRYSLGCQPVDWAWTDENFRVIHVGYLFWVSKLIELLDTVFFVLRKKNNQITFLHIFHHTAMPFAWWCGLNWAAGGMGTFHGMVNSFVHIIMYTYYGLAAIGPHMQKYLTWKKYITKLQLTQFVIVFAHMSQLFFIECDYSRIFLWMILSYTVVFFVLFSNFYIQAYLKKAKSGKHAVNGETKNGFHANGTASVENKKKE